MLTPWLPHMQADAAIAAVDGQQLRGQTLEVKHADADAGAHSQVSWSWGYHTQGSTRASPLIGRHPAITVTSALASVCACGWSRRTGGTYILLPALENLPVKVILRCEYDKAARARPDTLMMHVAYRKCRSCDRS